MSLGSVANMEERGNQTLVLRGIRKSFGTLEVLRGIDLDVNAGELLALVGPSGAGKTTLLQIAGTLERPDAGSILFGGVELSGLKDRRLSEFRNRKMGFVFQSHQLLPEFTARENVALPGWIAGQSKGKALARADELLARLGMSGRAAHKPGALSGGERQRTAIARALVNNPDIVFADEPTGSLDTANRDEIMRLIGEMRDLTGAAFMIVTHDPTLADSADRVVAMRDGKLV